MSQPPQAVPLAERMRPGSLDEFIGQNHLVGENGPVKTAVLQGNCPSMIFWGPPGSGKTTLAGLVGKALEWPVRHLSAISAGVADIRKVIEEARFKGKILLFIDEIHRFNKSQQDALLGAVEKGWITLIGATTENPSFEVNNALLSRCQVYVLHEFGKEELNQILQHALETDVWLQQFSIRIEETDALFLFSGGDARKLLNLLELMVTTSPVGEIVINNEKVTRQLHQKLALYDKTGEQHYDVISAFIKSMRGSDPNAAVYWLARMLHGGEDIKFIARRMIILASEDIGNANPNAMLMATQCFQAVSVIGMPEARIILSQTAIYLACSPKSNSSYLAIDAALDMVRKTGDLPVPLHLRNASSKLMKDLGYGKEYGYAHSHEGNFVLQEFLPDALSGSVLFAPGNNPREAEMRQALQRLWKEKYNY
ncbi:MAG: replication-associated recombination protein A [Bacteroidetes bacterium]|nr:replication-associated recombination protein A [Bacteroidota bacterium]